MRAYSYPLCLNKEIAFLYNSKGSLSEEQRNDFVVCPWYLEDIQRLIVKLRYFKETENDKFVSVLSFLIGERLIKNGSDEDIARGQEYIQHSVDLSHKQDTVLDDVLSYLKNLKGQY